MAVSGFTSYCINKDESQLEQAKFFGLTLLYYHIGVIYSYISYKLFGIQGSFMGFLPLFAAFFIMAFQEYSVKKESNANHANDALMTATIQTQPSVTTAGGEEAVQTTSRTRKTTDRNRKFKNRTTTTTIQTEEEQWYVEESSVDSGNDGWVDNNWQNNQATNPYVEPSQSTPDYSEPDSSYTPSTPDSSLPDDSGSGSDSSQPDTSLEDGGIE